MTPFLRGLFQQWVTRKTSRQTRFKTFGGCPCQHTVLWATEARLTSAIEGGWGFLEQSGISFWLVSRPEKQSTWKPRPGNSFCLLIGSKSAFPFVFIFQTYSLSQKASFLWFRKEINPLLGCVISPLTFLWWWQERSWLSLYISSGIRLLTCVHPSSGGSTSSQMAFFPMQAQYPLPF